MSILTLQTGDSLIVRLAHEADPIRAVVELVWNSIDAEASHVSVVLERDEGMQDEISGIVIRDDGHGINADQASSQFGSIGDSWKAKSDSSLNGLRRLHGAKGEGRLRAFALGEAVSWTSVADRADGTRQQLTVSTTRSSRTQLEIGVSLAPGEATGTVFRAVGAKQGSLRALDGRSAMPILLSTFAPVLIADRGITVEYDGKVLDPAAWILHDAQFEAKSDDPASPLQIRVIEWKATDRGKKRGRAIYYGPDLEHFVYEEDGSEIVSSVAYSAYIAWKDVSAHAHALPLGELAPEPVAEIWRNARAAVRDHLNSRQRMRRREQVKEWKESGVYPYRGDAPNEAEAAERAVFDVVAGSLGHHIAKRERPAKLTLALLREAVKADPDRLTAVLHEVASLTEEDLATLTALLSETTLPAIIRSTNIVANRRKFLAGLEHLIFDPDDSPTVGERDHLHKILERELWIFGEQYNLMNTERGLTQMLRSHLKLEGLPASKVEPVQRWDGKSGRVDLHLAVKREEHDRARHLIVELKAPRVTIDRGEVNQVEDYANVIADDPRFHNNGGSWDIILVGSHVSPLMQRRINKEHRSTGLVQAIETSDGAPEINIYIRKWRDIIDENRRRLEYLAGALELDPGVEQGLEYLRAEYSDLLPESLGEETEISA
jgi:hypothetical protein